MLLKELKTTYFDPSKKYTFVISMGATEQHGPFLPLGTDSYCQNAILQKSIQQCPEAIFLPTLEITCSKEHEGFAGTVWVEKETMMLILRDICNSLSKYANNIIFNTWHGGNIGTINRFIKQNKQNFKEVSFYHINLDPEEILAKTRDIIKGPVDEHAGNTETSMVLACDESLVTVPSANYSKHKIEMDWDSDNPLKAVSEDGIVDNHPNWVVDKQQGKIFIELSAEHLKNEINKIINQ
jgi:creatinine amidohydrolase/Fe(II)-dependent formamide hydrolase-like protein